MKTRTRKILSIITVMAISLSLCACAKSESNESRTLEKLYSNFEELSKIPRGTHNEKGVSDYLKNWAEEKGFSVTQDKANNIIFDVPATKGNEDKPLTVLQGHMDMVMAVDEGYDFDKEKDSIKLVREGSMISAEHTSLGADDGMGIAIIEELIESSENHGPLRIIITTDEEDTATGIKNLDASFVKDAQYLINIDSEESDAITIGSAGATDILAEKTVEKEKLDKNFDNVLEISIIGGAGGHSGNDIADGRINAIVSLCDLLYDISCNGIDYRLVSLEGGGAKNSIPSSAKAVIVTKFDDDKKVGDLVLNHSDTIKASYGFKNPEVMAQVLYPNLYVQEVMSKKDSDALVSYVINAISGVYTMSPKQEGLPESSANLANVKANTEKITVIAFARSSEIAQAKHINGAYKNLAEGLLFNITFKDAATSWPIKVDSKLVSMAESVYEKQNGETPILRAIHGGLECGQFNKMNPNLEIISVGPNIKDAHSTKESVDINTVVKTYKLVDGILAEIAKSKEE